MLVLVLSLLSAAQAACPADMQTHRRGLVVDGRLATAWNGEAEAAVVGCDDKLVDAVEQWHDRRRCTAISGGIGMFIWPVLGVTIYCGVKQEDDRAEVERLLK
jgi:hypothetical protein